jgi:predicted phosphodiesterase
MRGPSVKSQLPHRYGHDISAFLALDKFLRDTEWDLLFITGDVSRIGNKESFESVRNWLENEIVFGSTRVGLNLSKTKLRHYFIVPGNHDRFNGKLLQNSLENYHEEFNAIKPDEVKTISIKNETVNLHLYDSTTNNSFAYGMIEPQYLIPKKLQGQAINLALLHHHFLQPPKHPREIATELLNSAEVATYMLNTGFDGIFFGHTHKGYIGRPSVEILSGLLNDKRKKPRFWTRWFPKFYLRQQEKDCLVSYQREAAKNGQLPKLSIYFDYLYLRQNGHDLASPSSFDSIRGFYDHMNSVSNAGTMKKELKAAKQKRVLISLAPSACQAEADWNGFHIVAINRDEKGTIQIEWDRYEYNGAEFSLKLRDEHVS